MILSSWFFCESPDWLWLWPRFALPYRWPIRMSLILDPDVSFDPGIDFGFDEDIFSGAFEQESDKSPTAKWFEDFTIRISQSTSGQANNHAIDLGPFGSFPKEADLETNRLQFNVRYQNARSRLVLQGSMWYRVYWNQDYEYVSNGDAVETEGQLNDLFIQRSSGKHSFKPAVRPLSGAKLSAIPYLISSTTASFAILRSSTSKTLA